MTAARGPPGSDRPRLSAGVVAGGDRPETTVGLEVVRQCSADAPALAAISLENAWTRSRTFHFEYTAPFTPLRARDPDGTERLHLVPRGGRVPGGTDEPGDRAGEGVWSDLVPAAPADGCWRVAGGYARDRYGAGTVWSADPGESLSRAYFVLDSRDVADCFPAGTYRFDAAWREESPEGETARRTAEFAIEVER